MVISRVEAENREKLSGLDFYHQPLSVAVADRGELPICKNGIVGGVGRGSLVRWIAGDDEKTNRRWIGSSRRWAIGVF